MKRFISSLLLGLLVIASATSFTACQNAEKNAPHDKAAAPEATDAPAATPTEAPEEDNAEALAKKEAEEAARKEAQAIYEKNCQSCHAMAPPSPNAPSIIALAGQYRARYSKRAGAVADMASFIKEPAVGKSILGTSTLERFGLMAPLSLPDEELEKVAGWLWDQYDPEFEGDADCR